LINLSPSLGPIDGDTTIQITGENLQFGDDYRCRFTYLPDFTQSNDTIVATMAGSFSPPSTLSCISPGEWIVGETEIVVTLNSQQYNQPDSTITFIYFTPPQTQSFEKALIDLWH
jgi:hypothetical protein